MSEYPDKTELKKLEKWNVIDDPFGLLDFIQDCWHFADWGITIRGKRVKHLYISTGGWSGNEERIAALRKNYFFWSLFWKMSRAGGHFHFRIYKLKNSKKEEQQCK